MSQEPQKIACPAFLSKRLKVFRVGEGAEQHYLVQDPVDDKTYRFEPWEFFILEVLPESTNFAKLAMVFEDRFGRLIEEAEVDAVLAMVADNKLFGVAALTHPMVISFNYKRIVRADAPSPAGAGKSPAKGDDATAKPGGAKGLDEEKDELLLAGISDPREKDESQRKTIWKLFNPTTLLKRLQPVAVPFKYAIYLLPFLLVAALFVVGNHFGLIETDLARLKKSFSLLGHVVFSMFTDNLLVAVANSLVAYSYRATVDGFSIIFHFRVFPRFKASIGNARQLSRRERLWLYATPLLLRLGLFSTSVLLWYNVRGSQSFVASFALALAFVSALSFLLTLNPLVKSSGYYLIATYLDEPYLQVKAYKAVLDKFRGNTYQKVDSKVLVAYGLASAAFMLILLGVFLFLLGQMIKFYLGGAGYLLLAVVAAVILWYATRSFIELGKAYERSLQYERWRKRNFPTGEVEETAKKKYTFGTYLRYSLLLSFFIVMLIPYNYEPGGYFAILPPQKQEITSELAGIVDEVYFDGGEFLTKGTIIGRLSCTEDLAQEKIYAAKIEEQKAIVDELKGRPRPEEVALAESDLRTEETRTQFSKDKLSRWEKLFAQKSISLEELETVRREYQVDSGRVAEKRANLELIKSGATPDQVAAAEAKLRSLQEEHAYYLKRIEQSVFSMPFDGTLVAMQLKQKTGSFLDKGQLLATVENTKQVIAQIDVPEPDIGYVKPAAQVRARAQAYFDEDVTGEVTAIDTTVMEQEFGRVVRVTTVLNNEDGRLKSGMTGYAKISSVTLPVWEVLSQQIVRFISVEVWSWFP